MKLLLILCLCAFATTFTFAQSQQTLDEPGQSVVLTEEGDSPVILYDKNEITQGELSAMRPDQIGDIQILTGKEAKARFGKYSKNGVIVIASKAPADVKTSSSPQAHVAPSEQVNVANSDEVKMSFGSDLNAYVLIDGNPSTMEVLQTMKPDQIKAMEVLKGSEALKKYGEIAIEGAIEVTTNH